MSANKNKYTNIFIGIEVVFKKLDKSGTSITITCKRTEIITPNNINLFSLLVL